MKIKILMTCLLGLATAAAFAQKGELKDAQSNYDSYSTLRQQKVAAMQAQAKKAITDAKTSIDKAAVNDKTAALPQTYALKAAIYSSMAVDDTVATTSAPSFSTADEALKKAKELDTKGENKKLIDQANLNLAQYQLNLGVKDYQNKKYENAYKEFDYYRSALPADTNALYYTALSATNAGPKYYPKALENYGNLVKTNFSGNSRVYFDMSSLYLLQKDTTGALKVLGEGIAKYPNNAELRRREIEIGLTTGKQSEVLGKIQAAITNDPKSKELQFYLGLTYSQIGDEANKTAAKHDAAVDAYSKAADAYRKALEIDPNYFDANMNLGYVLMRPALDIYNAAQKLPSTKEKEYEADLAKSDKMLDVAKPYLQKAVDLQPKSEDALRNLWSYYRAKSDKAQAADNKAKAADIKKQIDALK